MKINNLKENNRLDKIEINKSLIKEPIKLELNKTITQSINTSSSNKLPDELGRIIDLKI